MKWIELKDIQELEQAHKSSFEKPIVIFKHSTRCATSSLVRNKLERKWSDSRSSGIKTYLLDLIRYREISNAIEQQYGIRHESPQVLVIQNGEVRYDASHFFISYEEVMERVSA